MHISSDTIGYIAIWSVLGLALASIIVFTVLTSYMQLAAQKPHNRPLIPLARIGDGRTYLLEAFIWSWTAKHRKVGDPELTGCIFVTRGVFVATTALFALMVGMPNFDVRIATWLNGLSAG
jgi:hypothetical protein